MRINRLFISLLVLLLFFSNGLSAQISNGGTPPSFKYNSKGLAESLNVEHVPIPFTVAELKASDSYNQESLGLPPCFAKNIEVNYNMTNSGSWTTLPDGQKIWRLRIKADGASAIILSYNNFLIPDGAFLFVYNAEHTQVIGSFTSETNPLGGSFSTEMIAGDDVILEYAAPKEKSEENYTNISIDGVGYVYDYINVNYLVHTGDDRSKYGESGTCMVNINCSEGNNWQIEKKGVCKMLMYLSSEAGWYLCTGTLVNNTAQDLTPYLISANHCYAGATDADLLKWQFIFHYESPTCGNAEPTELHTLVGSYFRANTPIDGGSDGLLLELISEVPSEWNVYYNGWDVSGEVTSGGGVGIHHPAGDLKKISTFESYSSSTWPGSTPGATDAHWGLKFTTTEHGHGVTEGGSSGSSLFNANHLIIGTLTGGNSTCTNPDGSNYYGKLWYHWDKYGNSPSTQFKTWLDPLNIGIKTLQGIDYNPTSPRTTVNKRNVAFLGTADLNVSSLPDTLIVGGYNLTSDISIRTNAPFEVSTNGETWGNTTNLSDTGGRLLVRYTPTVIGNQVDTIKISNSEVSYTLFVVVSGSSCRHISLSDESIPNAKVEGSYEAAIIATGSTAPFTYSLSGGILPDGLSMSESGRIAGTPTESGSFKFTITATDQYGCTGTKEYNLNVECGTIGNFPYTKDFEKGVIPSCWFQDFVSGNVSWTLKKGSVEGGTPANAHSGLINACFSSSNYKTSVTKLISPQFDITSLSSPTLVFWHAQAVWVNDQDELRVYYKTSAQGEWKLLAEYTKNIPNWTMEAIPLPESSSEYSVAFEGSLKFGYGVVLDDISIISPSISVSHTTLAFGDGIIGSPSNSKVVTVTGQDLVDSIVVIGSDSFNVSRDGISWDTTCTLNPSGGNLYVRFYPQGSGAKSDTLQLISTGVLKKISLYGTITGINDIVDNGILISPNPFTNELSIKWGGECESISVLSIIGQEVYSSSVSKGCTQMSIPSSAWSKGVYFVKLKRSKTYKVIRVVKD